MDDTEAEMTENSGLPEGENPLGDLPDPAAAENPLGDLPDLGAAENPLGDLPDPGAADNPLGDLPDSATAENPLGDLPETSTMETPMGDLPDPMAAAGPAGSPAAPSGPRGSVVALQKIQQLKVKVQAVLGTVPLTISELANLGQGDLIELETKLGEPIEILANGDLIARAEIVVTQDDPPRFGLTLTEIVDANGSNS